MEQVTAPAAPVTPAAIKVPVTLPPDYGTPPVQPKKPNTSMIIGGIVVVLVIIAVVSRQSCNVAKNLMYYFHTQHEGVGYDEIHRNTF
ncbi:MAG: hypothetical protein Q8N94_08160 [Methanoregula sp.]|nr:hypothetical protein [Methanoregula sp.]